MTFSFAMSDDNNNNINNDDDDSIYNFIMIVKGFIKEPRSIWSSFDRQANFYERFSLFFIIINAHNTA